MQGLPKVFHGCPGLLPFLQDQSQGIVGSGVVGIKAKGVTILLGSLLRFPLVSQHLTELKAAQHQFRINFQGLFQTAVSLIEVIRLHLRQRQLDVRLGAGTFPFRQG